MSTSPWAAGDAAEAAPKPELTVDPVLAALLDDPSFQAFTDDLLQQTIKHFREFMDFTRQQNYNDDDIWRLLAYTHGAMQSAAEVANAGDPRFVEAWEREEEIWKLFSAMGQTVIRNAAEKRKGKK
jgi:hypothetical protein